MIEMAISGLFGDRLDGVIFADSGFERSATYEIVDFYSRRWSRLGANVEILKTGDIRVDGARDHIHIPFRTSSGAPLRRQCTSHFKIDPIKRRSRVLLGFDASNPPHPPAGSIESWIGFSWDEFYRLFNSRVKFIVNRFPLIEIKANRWDNIKYLEDKGLPVPPPSACICCPFRSSSGWLEMRSSSPGDFQAAVDFDEISRHNPLAKNESMEEDSLYIYKKAIPLREADLNADAEKERTVKAIPLFVCTDSQCWT